MIRMHERLYAIGDIHGHVRQFADLQDRLLDDGMDPARDTVIFLGDYIDRGPESKRVVQMVRECLDQYPHWKALMGNHEDMLLYLLQNGADDRDEFDLWWYQGGRETFLSYGGTLGDHADHPHALVSVIGAVHRDWFASLPSMYETDRYVFVHGGLVPGRSPAETDSRDRIWIREPFLSSDYDWGKVVVHGHTPIPEPIVRPNRIGIDTILRGGYLTAVDLSGRMPRFVRSAP
jgi:serine/threonine protein phosphatase 1